MKALLISLTLCLALVDDVAAGDTQRAVYQVSGQLNGTDDVSGQVSFGTDVNRFRASFNAGAGAFGLPISFQGNYEEVNLLLISFWSFQGSVAQSMPEPLDSDRRSEAAAALRPRAEGTGITLFFGAFVFGSIESPALSEQYSFSGTFDEIQTDAENALWSCPAHVRGAELGHSLRGRARSPERI